MKTDLLATSQARNTGTWRAVLAVRDAGLAPGPDVEDDEDVEDGDRDIEVRAWSRNHS